MPHFRFPFTRFSWRPFVGLCLCVAAGFVTLWSLDYVSAQISSAQAANKPASTQKQKLAGPRYVESKELRARITKLQEDVAREATTFATLYDRGVVYWEWLNAYARQGGIVPIDAPFIAMAAIGVPPAMRTKERPGPNGWDVPKEIDRYIREMTLREKDPNALGSLIAVTPGPFVAGDFFTIVQKLTIGNQPLNPGAGILVTSHYFNGAMTPQATNPAGDNYVSITSSNPNVKFKNEIHKLTGTHGGMSRPRDVPIFRIESGTLNKGDTVTLTYGDKSGGSRGFQVQITSTDRFPLPVYIDLGNGDLLTMPLQPIEVVGGPVAGVRAFAPSLVGYGPATIVIRSEDKYGNRATGPIPGYYLYRNGRLAGDIPPGSDPVPIPTGKYDRIGVQRFTLRSYDGKIRGEANPIFVTEKAPEFLILWGETHGHSGFSEGVGTADSYYKFAYEDARLDFAMHSDHDHWMDDQEWEEMRANAKKYTKEGQFYAFLGYEWSQLPVGGGHHNVMFRTPEGRDRVPVQTAPVLSMLYDGLKKNNKPEDVLIIPHAHLPGDWTKSDPSVENLAEISSLHGNFEWFGKAYLANGHRLGFVGGSDDHFAHPGLATPRDNTLQNRSGIAAVITPKKNSKDIFTAMKARATYATSGERIILFSKLNGAQMGSEIAFTPERKIEGFVVGTAPIQSITVVKNGEDIWSEDYVTSQNPDTHFLQVEFYSGSEPYKLNHDTPRGWRFWKGTLTVPGTKILSVRAPGFKNKLTQSVKIDPENPSRVIFHTMTRGTVSQFIVEIDGQGEANPIEIFIEDAKEENSARYATRENNQTLKGADIKFKGTNSEKIGELVTGRHDFAFPVDDFYTDRMTLRRIEPQPLYDRKFSMTDLKNPKPGDSYYVRVTQIDGAQAWSSPVWVGNTPAK